MELQYPQGPEGSLPGKPRTKRTTDFPLFVAKKNRPKAETVPTVPPTHISPIKQPTPIVCSSSSKSNPSHENSSQTHKDGQKKNGFFSGITNLFKKKPLSATATVNENEVVATEADKFEYFVPSPETTLALGLARRDSSAKECPSPKERVEDTLLDEDRPAPQFHIIDRDPSTVDGTDAPIWEIFSTGAVSPLFECANILSRENVAPPSCGCATSAQQMRGDEATTTPSEDDDDEATVEMRSEQGEVRESCRSPLSQEENGDNDNAMEVWECYEAHEDTNCDSNLRERKVTWLFSSDSPRGGPPVDHRTTSEDQEARPRLSSDSDKAVLPMLFGNVTAIPETKKEYSKYFLKPAEIRVPSSALKKTRSLSSASAPAADVPVPKVVKQVSYSSVEVRFFQYTFGQGIPSDGGPSLGLDWDFDPAESLLSDIESFEEFRGGIIPDDADDDEDWDDNWRIPR
jgi:hypothetical protein